MTDPYNSPPDPQQPTGATPPPGSQPPPASPPPFGTYPPPPGTQPPAGYQPQFGAPAPGSPPPGYQPQFGAPAPGSPPPGYQPQFGAQAPGGPPPGYQPGYVPPASTGTNGVGIAAMVLGIVAIAVAFIPVIGVVGFLLGGLAVILGIVGLILKGRKRGMAIAGLALGVVSIVIAAVVLWVTAATLGAASKAATDFDKSDSLELQAGWTVDTGRTGSTVTGTVTNTSNKKVNLATISFDVVDASGKSIGTCYDVSDGISAGDTWEFEAICTVDVTDPSQVQLDQLAGF